MRKRSVIAGGLAAVALVVPAVPAAADEAPCGQLFESVTLTSDLA